MLIQKNQLISHVSIYKNMNSLIKILGCSFVILLGTSVEGFAQRNDNPLTHPSNYKTRSAGQRAFTKAEGTGVLTETVEAPNYKRPYSKAKAQKVSLEVSVNPKRSYKMPYTR